MAASRAMMGLDGVEWAAAAMGTPANLETLAGRGFDLAGVEVTANDCFLAVQASSDGLGDAGLDVALDAGEAALSGGRGGAGGGPPGSGAPERPRSFGEAVDALDGAANLAIVS